MTTWEAHGSLDDSLAFLRLVVDWYEAGNGGPWGIVVRADGRLIGTIGLHVTFAHARADLGYAISRDVWGEGYTTEAGRAVLRWGFEELGLNRIQAFCVPENHASERVMQKLGLTYEGTLHEWMFVKGQFDDLKMYAVLRRDA